MQTITTSTTETTVFTFPDGRTLGYAQYGDLNGYPVFLFHGTPGSRIWFTVDDPVAHQLGLRLIAVDRPGYGLSDFLPRRKFLDFTDDIISLANHLDIPKFAVLGISGGSIYTLACAYNYPERVSKVAFVAGVGEFKHGKPPKEMCKENRRLLTLSRKLPRMMRVLLNQSRAMITRYPDRYLAAVQKNVNHLCESDQKAMQIEENARFIMIHLQEAYRRGVKGAVYEAGLCTGLWGFDPSKIKIPVDFWHGTEDTLAPIGDAISLSMRLPNTTFHRLEGKGHFLGADEAEWKMILKSVV